MNPLFQSLVGIFQVAAPAVAGVNPVISLGLFAIEEAIKQEPAIAQELQALFSAGPVTPDQIAALRAKVAGESYAGFVPASALPAVTVLAAAAKPVVQPDPHAPPVVPPPAPLAANQVEINGVIHNLTGS